MEVYGNGLSRGLEENLGHRCEVHEYRPRPLLGTNILGMRLSRFIAYSWHARRHQGQINHIVDHGYGHLLHAIDPARTVVTVHDVIPLVRWRGGIPGVPPGRRPLLNLASFGALRRAAHLISDSDNTRRDLIKMCGCQPSRITVIHPGIDSIFRPYGLAEKRTAYRALNMPAYGFQRILIAGSEFYKNPIGALRAFARLRKRHSRPLELIKLGVLSPEFTRVVEELDLSQSVRCLGTVPRSQLPAVYNCVDCLLFPSLYEGFGWPPLEAMACGTPVVASNAGSLPEVLGGACLMVNPRNEEALSDAVYRVLTDPELRESLVASGLTRAQRFTWQGTAAGVMRVYEQVLGVTRESCRATR